MKSALKLVLFPFFAMGVYGADEVKTATEGDSVTLNSGVTEIQRSDEMEWRLNNNLLFGISSDSNNKITVFDDTLGAYGGRMQPNDQTGDLKITDIKTTDSGEYKLQISSTRGPSQKTFSVSVVPADPVKTVSVMVGDSVTLNTGVPEPQRYDVIQWRFKNSLIAEINRKTRNAFTSNTDERFRGRLQLDCWSGSLTIRNTETTHSGDYEYDISTSSHTLHRSFTVTVSDPGLSPGAKAGIVVAVLLAFAAVAGVIYYCRKNSELVQAWIDERTILSVMEGEPVTLKHVDTKVHKADKLLWMSADIAERKSVEIAEWKRAADSYICTSYIAYTVYDNVPDGRFGGRLELNPQTGSLTITNTKPTDTGPYELVINRPGKISIKRFSVSVFDKKYKKEIKTVSVKKGGPVTLETDVTDIQEGERILWKFGLKTLLAEITRGYKEISPSAHKIFKDRLKLDHQTGSLTINNISLTDAGIYMQCKLITTKLFRVSLSDSTDNRNNPEEESVRNQTVQEIEPVKEGESVTLETGVTDIKQGEWIQWTKFGLETPFAVITRGYKEISTSAHKIFQGRLELHHQTGSLTINNISLTDAGIYKQCKLITTNLFRVSLSGPTH